MDDGGTYRPSKPQVWLWECWERYWKTVAAARKAAKADLWVIYNGDCTEGDHHHTSQIISRNPDAQRYVADRVFGVPGALKPDRLFMVRGTEAHTGTAGSAEEALAKALGSERDEETGTWSRWRLRLMVHGLLVDCQHHGRMGQRPWTEQTIVATLAAQVFYEHARRGLRHPDLAFRSHLHRYADSGDAHPTRVVQTPAWQLKTSHVHKVAAESIADIGGVIAVIRPDHPPEIKKWLVLPALPKIVT